MRLKFKLDKYFLNPQNDNCGELFKQISVLDKAIQKLKKVDQARITDIVSKKYESYLKKSFIPQNEQNPAKVMAELSELFKGAVRWHHPGTMINVTPPPLIPTVAASTMTMLYNPNLAIDVSCGGLSVSELEVTKHMATLVNWDWHKAFGVFTFGGKGTNLYAVKVALNRYRSDFKEKGLQGKVAITSTEQGHPCHIEVCDWLGLGRSNCLRLPLDSTGRIDLKQAEKITSSFIEEGGAIPCMIVNGGTTLHNTVDPIKKMVQLRDRLVKKYKLKYKPHVHVDSVLGWAWLFFKDYDFKKNPEKLNKIAIKKLESMYKRLSEIKFADSFGVDFHKTGFCPYLSSVFISKDKKWIDDLGVSSQPSLAELQFGNYSPFTYTLESSRPLTGSVSALVALRSLGMRGFRKIISDLVTSTEIIKSRFDKMKGFCVANPEDENFVTLFMVLPPGIDSSYKEVLDSGSDIAIKIAEYNYKFYLFLMEKQIIGGSSLAIDYITGYEKSKSDIKLGVLKMYPVSPYFDTKYVGKLLTELIKYKKEFEKVADNFKPKACPHVPKTLVLR